MRYGMMRGAGICAVAVMIVSIAMPGRASGGEERDELTLGDRVTIAGLVEIEAYVESVGSDTNSDVTLATTQVGLSAKINKVLLANVVFLWEEDDTEQVVIDEGFLSASFDRWTIRVGRLYVPFGRFESRFVTDPMTLDMGETGETALEATYSQGPFDAAAAFCNGNVDINGGSDTSFNNAVAAVSVSPIENLCVGMSWIRNLADSDGLQDEFAAPAELDRAVPGLGAFVSCSIEKFSCDVEYVGALADFEDGELDADGDGDGDTPSTFNIEAGYVVRDDVEIAGRYESSNEFLDLPESRFGVCVSWELLKWTTMSFELMHSIFDDAISEDDATTLTVQAAVEF